MRRGVPILVFCLIAGCGGPRPGDRLTAHAYAVIYFDRDLLHVAAEIERAKSEVRASRTEDYLRHRWDYLAIGSVVRVLERTPDGLKVVVEKSIRRSSSDPELGGKIGWVLASDIGPE